jgi:uridine kinase
MLVAVDGVDGAGKTVFADEMGGAIQALGRPVIRASVDGFHHPRRIRYRRGRTSPEGYFHDAYDYAALRNVHLDPLRDGGSGRYRRAVFDYARDQTVDAPEEQAAAGAVLVLDGIFLHRPELTNYWDYSVFLQAGFEVTFARLSARDGCDPDPDAPDNRRYLDGQKLYQATSRPAQTASVIVDNNDIQQPRILE